MSSPATAILLAVTVAVSLFDVVAKSSYSDPYECGPTPKRDPRNLRHDMITVLINGFSESRIPLLQSLAATYSLSPRSYPPCLFLGKPLHPATCPAATGAEPFPLLRVRTNLHTPPPLQQPQRLVPPSPERHRHRLRSDLRRRRGGGRSVVRVRLPRLASKPEPLGGAVREVARRGPEAEGVDLHGSPGPVLDRAHEVHVAEVALPFPLHVRGWAPDGDDAENR
ncbi:hypothetical protein VNO77_41415 [Canavalia gladiata]|uniref:Uncharacterized protein n=1 Tax=Canavalia gladiata TaxID=3824 RepID=A0AAN9JZZ4_CANGL